MRLTTVNCAGHVSSTPQRIGPFEASPRDLVISVESGNGSILVSWRNSDQKFQQQLRSFQVTVTSMCPTGIAIPRNLVFTVTPDEGNSVIARGLGTIV